MKLLLILLSILSSFFTNLEKKTLQSDFTAIIQENGRTSHGSGSMTLKGSSFAITIGDNKAAYDGKTMYVYSPEIDELTLTEPTKEELTETNPFLALKSIAENSKSSEKTDAKSGKTIVTLIPNDPSLEVDQIRLHIRTADLMPLLMEVDEQGGTSSLQFINPQFITRPVSFVIEPEETTFVNDLRY